ncbi:hypothetical protein D3C72_2582800 [compost metagenome]
MLSVIVAISMGVVPVLIKLLERVPEKYGGMAGLPVADAAPAVDAGPSSGADKPPAG